MDQFLLMAIAYLALLVGASYYTYKKRQHIEGMEGMMVGMTYGLLAGLVVGTMYVLPTGQFLMGSILGTVVGLIFGMSFGRYGGNLGVMEGVMAGPMGGMMGAMLGQMMRPYNLNVFVPYFTFIVLITLIGMAYIVRCCCNPDNKLSRKFVLIWSISSIIISGASFYLDFSLVSNEPAQSNGQVQLPQALQKITRDIEATAAQKDTYQEIELKVTNSRYEPNIIYAKANIPLKIIATADSTGGCAEEIIFPELGIDKIIPENRKVTIDIPAKPAGTYNFHCSMNMMFGKIIFK